MVFDFVIIPFSLSLLQSIESTVLLFTAHTSTPLFNADITAFEPSAPFGTIRHLTSLFDISPVLESACAIESQSKMQGRYVDDINSDATFLFMISKLISSPEKAGAWAAGSINSFVK